MEVTFMSVNFKFIGMRIKEVREQRGMTQAELAERAELSSQYLSQVETTKKQVSLKALVHIANALEINIDSLLRGNQVGDKQEYQNELIELLKDCSAFEKRVIFEQARAIKKIIRESLPLVENKEKY